MLRVLLTLAVAGAAAALPTTADAAVVSIVSGDTLTITGDGAADRIALRPGPLRGTLLVDTGSVSTFNAATFSKIAIRSGAGNDEITIDVEGKEITVESGAGADVVTGGRGREVIASGDDGDLVVAGEGDDSVFLGAGDDTAIQSATDGFDVFEGQSGADTLQAVGSSESEELTVQGVGARARISRDLGGGADLAGIELAEIRAGSGSDLIDIGDLSGTGLTRVDPDLGLADGAPDTVFAQGSAVKDTVLVSALGDTARVTGLAGEVRVDNANPGQDRLIVQARGGDDSISAVGSAGALIALTLEGNEGADSISGGNAAETLRGGSENDLLRGQQGADVVEGGDGPDQIVWSPATDGNDLVRGDAGLDRLRIPTRTSDDFYSVAADGPRVRISGASQISADVDIVDIGLGSGADRVHVGDLAGTLTTDVVLDTGASDLKVDTITIDGTAGADSVKAKASTILGAPFHEISGLPANVFVSGAEPGDRLEINSGDGEDTIDATNMFKDKLQPFLNGGAAKDILVGSPGQDVITGGFGDDVAFLREGLDTFNWSAGDGSDIVEGGAGTDFLRMNGSGANERFAVSPIGGRTIVSRDVANIRIDTGDLERFDILPAGGADTMEVDDMSGTDAQVITWELAPFRGTTATDGALDQVLVKGTNGPDAISVGAGGHQVRVSGIPAAVEINRSDTTFDTLHVDTKLGNDLVSVAPGVHNLIKFSSS
jgi:Ca2+-binding RTX toxin-like protein